MKATASVQVGMTATKTLEVTHDLTIARDDSGLPAVFGTPMMIYLMEVAAAEAIRPHLPEGWISVGVVVNVRHLAATPVGAIVSARAEVIEVGDNTVTFKIAAYDGVEKIGEGTHVRAPVEVERFVRRVNDKATRMK